MQIQFCNCLTACLEIIWYKGIFCLVNVVEVCMRKIIRKGIMYFILIQSPKHNSVQFLLWSCICNFIIQAFINHGNEGRELCQGTDSFNNHLLHVACKHGNLSTLKVFSNSVIKLCIILDEKIFATSLLSKSLTNFWEQYTINSVYYHWYLYSVYWHRYIAYIDI